MKNKIPVSSDLHGATSHLAGSASATVLLASSGLTLWLLLTFSMIAESAPVVLQSPQNQVGLLELFTSEGCSSCPPAEKWLSGLKESPGLWTQFVPLALHVDYWDNLGWRDAWGSKVHSDRQRSYAEVWHTDSIYTPAFVLNGREWRPLWRSKGGPPSSGTRAGVLTARSSDLSHWQVTFSPAPHSEGDYELHAAVLANDLSSEVKAGENRGQTLNHDFVVTGLVTRSLPRHGEKLESEFEIKPPQATDTRRLALALWVTHAGGLVPLQATGGWLPTPHPN